MQGTPDGKVLKSLILKNEKIVSSELYLVESASALGKYEKAGLMSHAQTVEYLQDAKDLVDEYIPIQENYIEAFNESIKLNHSVYDMIYFTLARRNAATLVTLDTKLLSLCEEQGVECAHLVQE